MSSRHDELLVTPIPIFCAAGEEEVELGMKEGCGEGVVKIYFSSHYRALILLAVNSINVSNLSLFYL